LEAGVLELLRGLRTHGGVYRPGDSSGDDQDDDQESGLFGHGVPLSFGLKGTVTQAQSGMVHNRTRFMAWPGSREWAAAASLCIPELLPAS